MKKIFPILTIFFFVFLLPVTGFADETYPQSIANALANIQAVSGTNAFVPDLSASPARGNKAIITIQGVPASEVAAFGLKYKSYGGTNYLITRTLTNVGYYASSSGALSSGVGNYTTYNDGANHQASWVTTGNDATNFINANVPSAANLVTTMEKSLGMSGAGTHTAFVEYGVLPNNNNLMRPTNLLDIKSYSTDNADYTYHATFTPVNPGDMSSAVFTHAETYLQYWQTNTLGGGTFPWTELGYTYYWGHSSVDLNTIQGASEFIILGGTAVKIIGIYASQSYYYTKNKNGAFSTDSDAQYGNGFGSFNITGNCDTVWAGNAFQSEASTDPSSPNEIVIAGGATISGGQGILVWSPNYTVTNNGTISGATDNKLKDANSTPAKPGMSGTANVAVLFLGNTSYGDPGGNNKLNNYGTISSPGTAVEADAGNTEITNGGTISGADYGLYFKTGTNSITNSGTIEATAVGGTAIRIESGTTSINNTGGNITGHVTLVSDVTTALDIGSTTLTISGSGVYTQSSLTTLKVTANSSADFGKISSNGAAAAVASDSNLQVTVGGYIPNNTTFSNMIKSTGVGVNVPGAITSTSPIFTFSGTNGTGDHLDLTATRSSTYNSLAANSNGAATGAALEAVGTAGATGDILSILNTLDSMTLAQEISNALETMTPDMSSGAMQASQAAMGQFLGTVSNRLGYARNGMIGIATGDMVQGMGFWLQGLGSHMKQDARKGIEGFKANLFGTSIGADKMLNNHVRLGLAGGYGFADVNSKQPGRPSDSINSWSGVLYGSFDSTNLCTARHDNKNSRLAVRNQVKDNWYVDGMFGFTQNNYDSRREIWLTPTSARVAKAEHYGQQYSTKLETGYTFVFEMTKNLETTPFASLAYSYLRMNKYKEKGADSLSLTVDGEGYNQMLQTLGLKFAYPLVSKKAGTFIPAVKAAWLYDYFGDRFETTASFAGGGPSFNTQGAKPAKNGFLLGGELGFLNKGNMTLTANYDLELKDEFISNTYYATARFDF